MVLMAVSTAVPAAAVIVIIVMLVIATVVMMMAAAMVGVPVIITMLVVIPTERVSLLRPFSRIEVVWRLNTQVPTIYGWHRNRAQE